MSEHAKSVIAEHEEQHLSLGKYIGGFLGSIVLTLTAYLLVTQHAASKDVLVGVLAVLAIVQFIVQMVFFLHLGEERRPRWKLMVAAFMLGVVFIVVFGSLWIMNNLNYRMTPQQVQQYLKSQDNL